MKPYRCFPLTPVTWIAGLCLATLILLGAFSAGPPTMTAAFHISGEAAPAASNQPQGAFTIPHDNLPVTLDGICDSGAEYSEAAAFLFNDTPISGTVFLKQDDSNLYVCMEGSLGSYPQRFASVYLDTDNGQEDWAQADDYALRVDIITGTLSSWTGTGVPNGYASASLEGWTAVPHQNDSDYAEYKIPIVLTGGTCNAPFGISVYHHWVNLGSGDDYGWPSNQWFDQPQTWQTAQFELSPCPSADLVVYKYDAPDPVTAGTLLTYTVVVDSPTGPDLAPGIKLTDTLPAGVTFLPALSDARCNDSGGIVTCDLGDLDPGWNTTVYLVVMAPATPGLISNSATATARSLDENPGNNTAVQETTVEAATVWADLSVINNDAPDPVIVNTPLTYTLTIYNAGPGTAVNATLNDTLPQGVTTLSFPANCDKTDNEIFCTLGDLPTKTGGTVTIVVSPKNTGTIMNGASVGSDTPDPNTANNTAGASTTVNPPSGADLALTKRVSSAPALVGENLVYTVTVTNRGPSVATGVKLTDTLPTGLVFVSVTPGSPQCNQTAGVITCNRGNLAANASVSTVIVARATQTGLVRNYAYTGALTPDPEIKNNVASVDKVITTPDIMLYGLEITQGIQNLNSDMPLVANRDTRARGYARTTGPDLPNVRARLWAIRGGTVLPHSPAEAMWTPNPVHRNGADRLNLRDAFFFYIWPEWRSGTVTFRLEVNYDHAVAESDYTNNTREEIVTFYGANSLNVVMINSSVGGLQYNFSEAPTWPIINGLHRHHPIANLGVWLANLSVSVDAPFTNEDILDEVDDVDFWTSNPVPGVHYVGMINKNVAAANGQGYWPGYDLWLRMIPPDGLWPTWVYNGGATFSHEMGHNKGIGHIYCGARDFIDPQPYPWIDPHCALDALDPLGYYGLDVQHGRWGLPAAEVISNDNTAATPHRAFPIMGYTWPRWTSPWEWCRLLRAYNVPCGLYAQTPQEVLEEAVMANPAAYADPTEVRNLRSATLYLRASGVISPIASTADFRKVTTLPNPLPDAVEQQIEKLGYRQVFGGRNTAGRSTALAAFTLVQVNDADIVLATNDILLSASCDGAACAEQPFAELVPYASGATKLQVRAGATVLAERAASANPPTVTLLSPNGGETVGTATVVQWSDNDTDGNSLTFNLLYSPDNGATWRAIALNISGHSATISAPLPGTTQGLLRIVAMDGFHSAEDTSDGAFTVAGHAPLAQIIAPFDSTVAQPNSPVEFQGTATDVEDGTLTGNQLVWTSNRDGALGAGDVIALDTLTSGLHRITLTVTDSDGQTGSQTISIIVGHRIFMPLVLKLGG